MKFEPQCEPERECPSEATRSAPATGSSLGGRRLVLFLLGLFLVLAFIECLVRLNAPLFYAASHRALTKAAILDRHPRTDVLFLGTSRTQDGVSPELMSRALGETAPQLGPISGYNAAFTGSSLDALISLAGRFSTRQGLRLLVVELSEPQIVNEPAPWEAAEAPPKTLEERLGHALSGASYLVRYRTAFLPDNLGRWPALLVFGSALSGWETRGSDQLASWLGHKEKPPTDFDARLWVPTAVGPQSGGATPDARGVELAQKLTDIAAPYTSRGIRVIFIVPPMTSGLKDAPERGALKPLFSELARRSRCEVWDYSDLVLPDRLFRDPSHLGREGRAHFSRALALRFAPLLDRK